MSLKDSIKPISYLKANTAEVVRDVSQNGKTLYITQNGEAKVVVLSITEYEKNQDTLTMLRILALGEEDVRKGRHRPAKEAFADLKKRIKKYKNEL
ncbi:MAG TPA: type II toxin-antitoxin system Phd/YefM family antitoxin [Ignavibacteria bacterium]|nr:type II toxin-antitoxin system Phd/YefM family antitoxin [Ignavibacteria bacterium]HMR41783.1 type II toxin-antitoxin system Phd/YefM family antitoxin [Ignavibacteria bacterium]